jgi:aldose 1-epimerase
MSRLHILENENWQVGLLPETGMSTAFGRIRRKASLLDFMRPTPPAAYDNVSQCASYLLVPWSNRIAAGRFRFRTRDYELRINSPDGTAMHGVVKDYSWLVQRADRTRITAIFDAARSTGVNFPFAFSVWAEFALDGPRFVHRLSIRNDGRIPMPAGLGHHPYFQRGLVSADDDVVLQIPCAAYFPADKCIPTGPAAPVDARLDFRRARSIGSQFIDDCLTQRIVGEPVLFSYPRANIQVALDADELFRQFVMYAPVGKSFFAVEPVTNANDGFNLYDRGVAGSGVLVLEPGEEKTVSFALEVRDRG